MSRFDTGRRLRIAVWTGAAMAWGTMAAIAAQRSAVGEGVANADLEATATVENTAQSASSVPKMPAGGLVILRFQPAPKPQPEVITVRTQAPSAVTASRASAPTPRSSGS